MVILGISAYYHDSSAALYVNGKIVAAAQEERFTRVKHDNSFPSYACKFCTDSAGLSLSDVDYVVFYEKPFLKFERILKSYICSAPKSFMTFQKAIPIWLHGKLNMRGTIEKELKKIYGYKPNNIRFIEHHLSHAALAYYTSGFEDADVLVIDAVGESVTTTAYHADDSGITALKELHFPNSIGILYSAFTEFLGFRVNSDEYKVMGLAPYGDINSSTFKKYYNLVKSELITVRSDGSFELNLRYFKFHYGLNTIHKQRFEKLFNIKQRNRTEPILNKHKNLACAIQTITIEIVSKMLQIEHDLSLSRNLCISGGVALNCAMNGVLADKKIYDNIFIPFAPGDCGCAIGACLALASLHKKEVFGTITPYLGPIFSDSEIENTLLKFELNYEILSTDNLCNKVAALLANGCIVGWFQGRMELGPRALGNRSILANPQLPEMKDKINSSVKFRESFRPFAPSVIKEYSNEFFENCTISRYMMSTYKVKDGICSIPAVTHIDRSSRVQTVSQIDNELFYKLLTAFHKVTGCPMLLNTSFNVMGEPIVCTPADALNTFMNSGLEYVAIGHYLISKNV